MTTKLLSRAAALAVFSLLGGCASVPGFLEAQGDAKFGEANRQTMMAQVIDPDPVYDGPLTGSGAQSAAAIERYRTDQVKQPDSIRTTEGVSSNSSN